MAIDERYAMNTMSGRRAAAGGWAVSYMQHVHKTGRYALTEQQAAALQTNRREAERAYQQMAARDFSAPFDPALKNLWRAMEAKRQQYEAMVTPFRGEDGN